MACGLKRILQLNEAMTYQNVFVYDYNLNITNKCLYSWSSDGVCWTNWTTIDMYDRICPDLDSDFYLKIL